MNIPEGDDSDYVKIAEIVVAAHAEVGKPGAFLADLLPSMKYIPAWFPGAGWKRKANYWRKLGECFVHMPWNIVKEQLVGYISLILGRVPTFRTEARYSRTLHCSQSHREITGWNITWSRWRRDDGSQYMCSCFCWWVFPPSSNPNQISKHLGIGGADTVSWNMLRLSIFRKYCITRLFQQFSLFSWPWHSILRPRRRHKRNLTGSLATVCPNSTIDQTSHISMPWWKNRWDGNLSLPWVFINHFSG